MPTTKSLVGLVGWSLRGNKFLTLSSLLSFLVPSSSPSVLFTPWNPKVKNPAMSRVMAAKKRPQSVCFSFILNKVIMLPSRSNCVQDPKCTLHFLLFGGHGVSLIWFWSWPYCNFWKLVWLAAVVFNFSGLLCCIWVQNPLQSTVMRL